MNEARGWREEWAPFRVRLIELAAICFVQRRHEATAGARAGWAESTEHEKWEVTELIAEVFFAMDNAMTSHPDFDGLGERF